MGYRYSPVFEQVKSLLTMKQVAERYGYEVNRQGKMCCPFHSEKTASFTIYERSFYCFGCGEGGDLITFVSKLFNVSLSAAVFRLDSDFGMGITGHKYDKRAVTRHLNEIKSKKKALEDYRKEYMNKTNRYAEILALPKPKRGDQGAGEYAKALGELEFLNYWFLENHWR